VTDNVMAQGRIDTVDLSIEIEVRVWPEVDERIQAWRWPIAVTRGDSHGGHGQG
jgi:hypothetical protein